MIFVSFSLFFLAEASIVVRDVGASSLPDRCVRPRNPQCASQARDIFVYIRQAGNSEFETKNVFREVLPEYTPETIRSCLRSELYHLRRSLYMGECVFDHLTRWNQNSPEGTVFKYSDFEIIPLRCEAELFMGTPCQIMEWYRLVFGDNIGALVDSLGLHKISTSVISTVRTKNEIPVWVPNPRVAESIIDHAILRVGFPQDMSVMEPERVRVDETDNSWVDVLYDHFGVPSADLAAPIAQVGILTSPAPFCLTPRRLSSGDLVSRVLRYMRDDSTEELDILQAMRRELGLDFSDPSYAPVYSGLSRIRKNFFVTLAELERMLWLNRRNINLTPAAFTNEFSNTRSHSICALQRWYYYVINPMAGKTVADLNLREHIDAARGAISFSPSMAALKTMIESELSRIVV
jgi:hypothetical protein